jgi:hypothetical protein
MPSPDKILSNWNGIINNDFAQTIAATFELADDDAFIYRAESFAMTLLEIRQVADKLKYKYQAHGKQVEVGVLIQLCRVVLTGQASTRRYNSLHFDLLKLYRHYQSSYDFLFQCKEVFSTGNGRPLSPVPTTMSIQESQI